MRPNCASACFCSNPWIRFPIHMHAAGYPPGGVFFAHHHHRTPGARLHTARSYAGQGHHTTQTRGARGGECWTQREIGERLGVDHKTISNDLGKNCSFAKIPQDLGEQRNEQALPSGPDTARDRRTAGGVTPADIK